MSCDSNRVDRCLDRDEDWVLTIFCQNADAPGGIGTARDLTGLQAKLWIKTQDGAQVIHGQVGAIGTAVATPPDHRPATRPSRTRCPRAVPQDPSLRA